jgi:hypothetical protein
MTAAGNVWGIRMGSLRRRLAACAVLVTSLTVVVGCVSTNSSTGVPGGGSPTVPGGSGDSLYPVGTLLVSDGTATVRIGGKKVAFPSAVTDAAWSPDGSRIAFVGADGNVDSAHPDGTGRLVLTKSKPGVSRSGPAWRGTEILFTERGSDGVAHVESVASNGHNLVWNASSDGETQPIGGLRAGSGDLVPQDGNSLPSAIVGPLPNGVLSETVFQHQGAAGPEVWIIDQYQREPTGAKLADGSQPSISPDGSEVAYLGADGRLEVVSATLDSSARPARPTALSTGLSGASHLAWSPDGKTLTFSTAAGLESLPVLSAAGSAETVPGGYSARGAVATYLGPAKDRLDRLAAGDAVGQSVAGVRARWKTARTYAISQSPDYAYGLVLANPDDGVQAALVSRGAPLLFTPRDSLDPRTAVEMARLFGTIGAKGQVPTVAFVGGPDRISEATQTLVRLMGYKTERVAGSDQYAVDAAMVKSGVTAPNTDGVVVVSGTDPAAVIVASVAASGRYPVLLTRGAALPPATAAYLAALPGSAKIYAVGAAARHAIAAWSGKPGGVQVVPLVGSDDAETSVLVARAFSGSPAGVLLADSARIPDLAVAADVAQEFGYALLVVDQSKGLENSTRQWLDDSSAGVNTAVLVDSGNSLHDGFADSVGRTLAGPLGFEKGTLAYPW